MRRNFSSDSNLNSSSNSILKTTHPELFFFAVKFVSIYFHHDDTEEEFNLRKKNLFPLIIPPVLTKIPESGRSLLANHLAIYLELQFKKYSEIPGKNLAARIKQDELVPLRDILTIYLFISLSLVVSGNHREIFFPKKNTEEIEKDIEKACSKMITYLFIRSVKFSNSEFILGEKNPQIGAFAYETFIPIIFSIWGDKSALRLNNVSEYFQVSFFLVLHKVEQDENYPPDELIKRVIKDIKRMLSL